MLDLDRAKHLAGVFGCEEDKWSPSIYADGSYDIRPEEGETVHVTFGFSEILSPVHWELAEGYLPCHVHTFSVPGAEVTQKTLADVVEYAGARAEAAFTRVTVKNTGKKAYTVPFVSVCLTVIAEGKRELEPGEETTWEYAVFCDKLGNDALVYPDPSVLTRSGSFDVHYRVMRRFWETRLREIVSLDLPDGDLVNAYRAGYIYTLIIKNGYDLWVGANGYQRTFSHDSVGILQGLFTLGDFRDARAYIEAIPKAEHVYIDGFWKLPWVYAVYLLKTGDLAYIRENFAQIRAYADRILSDRDPDSGMMQKTWAIDSEGYWTIDNASALTGLAAYAWICDRLGEEEEAREKRAAYDGILEAVNKAIEKTQKKYHISYIPMSPILPNRLTPRSDPRDANWASMMLFGRWQWDGYLFGGKQEGPMLDAIDATYAWGIRNRRGVSDSPYNFGGYPHGYYCSAYNAGYGAGALRGEKYRDMGIRAYRFMIDNAQSGPYSFWEGIWRGEDGEEQIWDATHVFDGGGSSPHMWGQATAAKVLVDSVASLHSDGTLIVGRGIPDTWLQDGCRIAAGHFPGANGQRLSVTVERHGKTVTVSVVDEISGKGNVPFSVELPYCKNRVRSCSGTYHEQTGAVLSNGGTLEIRLK